MESFDDYVRRMRGRRGPSEPWQKLLVYIPWGIGLLLILGLLFDGSYTVAPHEQAVVLRFGRYRATVAPGLHVKLPVIDQVMKVSVEEHGLRLPLGSPSSGENAPGSVEGSRPLEEETLMLTGDLNTASVEWTIAWRVTEPSDYLFRFPRDVGDEGANAFASELITFVARTVMNRLVGDYSFDEVIGPKRSDIANEARAGMQHILDEYRCGITVTALQMQRVVPPDLVKPAFDRVNASIQEKQKLENEAEAQRNKLLPEAKAARDKLIREAEGYASRRRAESQGEIEALLAKHRAYQRAPELTRQRLYLEAMQDLLIGIKDKTIIDGDLKQLLPLLNLNTKGGRDQ
ncbi:Modulator of FtsH protease HflK [Aquisphaera giovannonii]|uniref:Protein HflK n=1 Tax=Aquisphaera giovannonii TaxID=406548 RepID=A0A5B9WBG7_9BACT|nr:FtsH protease activity modulator HflK [Aquisphaera giovannonii]QEH37946.1 Modulator of FtsH protease HflK [Aquisphaera giovannonii]